MRLVFVLLLFCNAVVAQSTKKITDSAFIRVINDLPAKEPFDTAHTYKKVKQPYIYLTSSYDIYDLFGYETSTKYRNFNFKAYHILGTQQCRQCLLHCNGRPGCHRNSCHMEWVWVLRENSKAFTEITITTLPQEDNILGTNKAGLFYDERIIKSETDSLLTNWYTVGRGDCHAHFKYNLFQDNFNPVVVLFEWAYYGGCRAAGWKPCSIIFKMPDGILHTTKQVIRADR